MIILIMNAWGVHSSDLGRIKQRLSSGMKVYTFNAKQMRGGVCFCTAWKEPPQLKQLQRWFLRSTLLWSWTKSISNQQEGKKVANLEKKMLRGNNDLLKVCLRPMRGIKSKRTDFFLLKVNLGRKVRKLKLIWMNRMKRLDYLTAYLPYWDGQKLKRRQLAQDWWTHSIKSSLWCRRARSKC